MLANGEQGAQQDITSFHADVARLLGVGDKGCEGGYRVGRGGGGGGEASGGVVEDAGADLAHFGGECGGGLPPLNGAAGDAGALGDDGERFTGGQGGDGGGAAFHGVVVLSRARARHGVPRGDKVCGVGWGLICGALADGPGVGLGAVRVVSDRVCPGGGRVVRVVRVEWRNFLRGDARACVCARGITFRVHPDHPDWGR